MLLSWLPNYFLHHFGLDLKGSGYYSALVYGAGVAGDALGGWLSDWLLRRTDNLHIARTRVICLSFAAAAACLAAMQAAGGLTAITACLAGAFFFMEISIGAFWAIPGDIAPAYSGTASGLMNVGSALAAVVSPPIFGFIIDETGDWSVPFYGSIGLLLLGMGLCWLMKPERAFSSPASASAA